MSAANPVVCRWHGEHIVMWRRGTLGCSLSVDIEYGYVRSDAVI
jgi:hypothetical protein